MEKRRAYPTDIWDSAHSLPVAQNLLDRRLDGWQPDRAWVSDTTFVGTGEGWLYLAAIVDLGSRRIVGWSMSERIDAELVCHALRSACWQRKPSPGPLINSDRGPDTLAFAIANGWTKRESTVRRQPGRQLRQRQGCDDQ